MGGSRHRLHSLLEIPWKASLPLEAFFSFWDNDSQIQWLPVTHPLKAILTLISEGSPTSLPPCAWAGILARLYSSTKHSSKGLRSGRRSPGRHEEKNRAKGFFCWQVAGWQVIGLPSPHTRTRSPSPFSLVFLKANTSGALGLQSREALDHADNALVLGRGVMRRGARKKGKGRGGDDRFLLRPKHSGSRRHVTYSGVTRATLLLPFWKGVR